METNEKKPKRPRIGENRVAGGDVSEFGRPEISASPSSASQDYSAPSRDGSDYDRQPYNRQYNNQQGGYKRPYNNQGGYNNRPYNNNRQQGGFNRYDNNRYDNGQGGYRPRPNFRQTQDAQGESNAQNLSEGHENTQQEGGYTPRQQGYTPRPYNNNRPYNNRQQGGYNNNRPYNNNNRPYNNRQQGGYNNRYNNQDGEYNNQGGYNNNRPYNNRQQGGYNNNRPYNNNNRPYNNNRQQGGYNNRQGAQRPGNRQGGAFPRQGKSFTPRPKRIEYEMPVLDPNEQIRLNKYMANAGLCSRREADLFIQQGLVKVNGEVATELGTKISHSDVVEFNEKVVALERKCYILLNKPKDCVTTSDDPNGRTTVMDIVKGACEERIYPVGRLDRNTTGVLLLTNDGDLASKLTHPKYVKKKIYHVWTDKDISEDDMQRIADGIELEDGPIHADAISYATETDRNQAGIEIHSGRNRIVRRIFESLGYHVTKLDRVYFAGLTKKNLPRGRWRYLTQEEVNFLKMGSFE
ncbi:MAG: rRNA pseudouridine synthase [Muribaculaceae bacterium]|nr:rRNA pseudouridine synthase [Muribaculaceae bacterium]